MNEEKRPVGENIFASDLKESRFSPGDLYMIRNSGKKVLLFKLGDILDPVLIKRFNDSEKPLLLDRMVNFKWVETISNLFLKFKDELDHREKDILRNKIIVEFKNVYVGKDASGSLVDLMFAGERAFYSFSDEHSSSLQDCSSIYYQRSSLIGFLAAISSLILGYADYKYLQDVYHMCFLFDYGLCEGGVSYNIVKAQELERIEKGKGVALLKDQFESKEELDNFKDHFEISKMLIKRDFQKYFSYRSVYSLIDVHHEKLDGSGYSEGTSLREVSDVESVIMFFGQMISYDFMNLSFDDGRGYFKKLISDFCNKNEMYSTSKIVKILRKSFDDVKGDTLLEQKILNKNPESELESNESNSEDGKVAA